MGEVEFLFDHGRAFGYLAGLQIEGLAKTKRRGGDLRPGAKDRLGENTDHGIKCFAFGAPTFFVGDEMFRGK